MKKIANNRGITLIALIVTIIVLLILAGISISMLTGQNGILNRASEAKEKTEIASEDEKRKLAQAEALMNTEKTTYKGVTLPEGFAPTKIEGEDSIDDGLVITDAYGNEYVWVEVLKTDEVYPTAGLNVTAFTDEEYVKIEKDLHTYTIEYKNYSDEYYQDDTKGWFEDEDEYNKLKKKMLKSIYMNEGFWVGRYEAGIEKNRKAIGDATIAPLSKANLYPYNYVTRTQAKVLAEKNNAGSCTSSLMFGIQWNLMLKYIENKEMLSDSEMKTKLVSNSTSIGNYKNNLWNITNEFARYSVDYGKIFLESPYKKTTNESIMLTTGADKSFSLANIYDTAGNVWEWTLEKSVDEKYRCVFRGGDFNCDGTEGYMESHSRGDSSSSGYSIGFRIAIY